MCHYLQLDDLTSIFYSLFFSHNYSLFCSQWRSSNHDCSLHTPRNFTQDWLNSYYSSSALSWPFIVLHKQSNERCWSRMFVFSLSRGLYRDYTVFCVLCTHCCLCIRILVYLFFSYTCCCWFTGNKFDVFVSVVFVCRLMLNYIIVSIFITIFYIRLNFKILLTYIHNMFLYIISDFPFK